MYSEKRTMRVCFFFIWFKKNVGVWGCQLNNVVVFAMEKNSKLGRMESLFGGFIHSTNIAVIF